MLLLLSFFCSFSTFCLRTWRHFVAHFTEKLPLINVNLVETQHPLSSHLPQPEMLPLRGATDAGNRRWQKTTLEQFSTKIECNSIKSESQSSGQNEASCQGCHSHLVVFHCCCCMLQAGPLRIQWLPVCTCCIYYSYEAWRHFEFVVDNLFTLSFRFLLLHLFCSFDKAFCVALCFRRRCGIDFIRLLQNLQR